MQETGRVIVDRKTFAEDYESEQVAITPLHSEDGQYSAHLHR